MVTGFRICYLANNYNVMYKLWKNVVGPFDPKTVKDATKWFCKTDEAMGWMTTKTETTLVSTEDTLRPLVLAVVGSMWAGEAIGWWTAVLFASKLTWVDVRKEFEMKWVVESKIRLLEEFLGCIRKRMSL